MHIDKIRLELIKNNLMKNNSAQEVRRSKLAFKKQDSIGGNDAADDKEFLLSCFVDLGDLEQIVNFNNPKCILLGRTGAGKTALITKLKADHDSRVIIVDPEALAMQYIANSTIVTYLIELGIDLNTFFKLLWRHEICVEIFNRHVKVASEVDHEKFMETVRYEFKKRNPAHIKALDYLEQWKDTFWKTSDSHVTAMVTTAENTVEAGLGVGAGTIDAKIKGTGKLTEEEVVKVKQLGQSIVDDLQMKEVTGLLDMLNDFIELHQSRYYIVLDELDEKWVGNDIRYQLIKSLIETAKELNRLSSIKPVIVLRHDLLGRVFSLTRDTGFQEEKYTPLYLDVKWSKEQLVELINLRINHLLHSRYSKKSKLTFEDVLPAQINEQSTIDYIVDRTLMRPRDIIEFINKCIYQVSLEDGIINENAVLDAEVDYSQGRLSALAYEWFTDYPGLKEWFSLLKKKPKSFLIMDIDNDDLLEKCFDYIENPPTPEHESKDLIFDLVKHVKEKKSINDFKKELIHIFYQINLVGLKNEDDRKVSWFHLHGPVMTVDDIEDTTEIIVHTCYVSALRIKH
jgi:hypothetical protein